MEHGSRFAPLHLRAIDWKRRRDSTELVELQATATTRA